MRRVVAVLALVALAVSAGCTGLFDDPKIAEPESNRPDPDADLLGWEDGYWWNDSVAVNATDGLSKPELEAVTARMMARIEHLRGHEFTDDVEVTVISREEYRSGGGDRNGTPAQEQFWEATFVLDEETGVGESMSALYGSAVQGYYTSDRIVVVSDGDSDELRISRATLVHELEHALQDQQLTLEVNASSRDETLAGRAVVEGDANYVESIYEARCENETWDCVEVPKTGSGGGGPPEYNRGLFVSTFLPYGEGPTFVESVREAGGWSAVDALFTDQPASTEQVIHPRAYPDERPRRVAVPDRSNGAWDRVGEPQRVGEATAYAMFYHNGQIPTDHWRNGSTFDYDHPITAGWGGDALVAYTDGNRYGYVWRTTWDSRTDAREFHEAYLELLDSKGATAHGDGVYVIEDDGFADAFRVVRSGDTVLVVNAPTVGTLDGVHDRASPSTIDTNASEIDAIAITGSPATATAASRFTGAYRASAVASANETSAAVVSTRPQTAVP